MSEQVLKNGPGTELDLAEHYRVQNLIISDHLEGQTPNFIAKKNKLPIRTVMAHLEEFKSIAKSDELLRARAQEVVHEYDSQQNKVQREMWRLAEDAEQSGDMRVRGTVLKNIADVQAKRVEVLQKSGLLADNKIAEEMAIQQEKQDELVKILKEVSGDCPKCKIEIARRLSRVTGEMVPVDITNETIVK